MATTPAPNLATRLNLKPDMRVLLQNDQAGIDAILADGLGAAPLHAPDGRPVDAALLFAAGSADLQSQYTIAKPALAPTTMLWVMYPKKSSGIKTDLSREEGWSVITVDGWQGVRQIAVDETWSALRYKQVADAEVRGSVESHYAGAKAHLLPVFQAVQTAIEELGPDVSEPLVRGNYVAWSRKSHFVAVGPVGPAKDAAVGVAVKFRDDLLGERMVASNKVGGGAFTHLLPVRTVEEVDDELRALLRRAYEANV
jgi:hypothetical protein